MESQYLYLWVMLGSIAVPLIRSFEKQRVKFYQGFKPMFIAIGFVGLFFIIWDIIFTQLGFWGFNPKYLSGIFIVNLPIEEVMFFVVIPYCFLFTYEVLNYFVPKDILGPYAKNISLYLLSFSAVMAVLHYDKWYTLTTAIFLSGTLAYVMYMHKPVWLGRFYLSFFVIIIPFFIVNGILTGWGIEEEIVWYNEAQFLGYRMGTIPVEDTFYGMGLLLAITIIYERLFRKR